ncbi:MAG: response regulator [Terracidiphilus sp.]
MADHNQEVIRTIRSLLDDDFEVIKVVENGAEALSAVLALDPDVFVTDIAMPHLNGFEAARSITRTQCRAKIIFLSIHEDAEFIAAALGAGAMGYVTKPRLSTDLVIAIRSALKGRVFVSHPESVRI